MDNKKVYFNKGDEVVFKHDLDTRPEKMIVIDVAKTHRREEQNKTYLIGILCCWFDEIGAYHEHRFNTKDLIHYENS